MALICRLSMGLGDLTLLGMAVCGSRLRTKLAQRCGRQTGTANGRCYLHGGLSTGPRRVSLVGLSRVRRLHGWPRGKPRTRKGLVRLMAEVVETLPAAPSKPLEEWSGGELLSQVARLSLMRAIGLMTPGVADYLDTGGMRR